MFDTLPLQRKPRMIATVAVAPISRVAVIAMLRRFLRLRQHGKIGFANAHFVNEAARDAEFAQVLPQFLILPDGIGVDIASRVLYGEKFPANLNGTDFVPWFLAGHRTALTVGLLGAKPGVAESAAAKLAQIASQHRFVALSHGYLTPQSEAALLDQLARSPVDVLLVAMGNPVQEKWIARCIGPQHAHLAFGVGALFDFMAGEVIRAPEWVRACRLEWVWRLAQEPGRLWRRYILGNPSFLLRVARQKLSQ